MPFWLVFFPLELLPAAQKIFPKRGLFSALGELRKSIGPPIKKGRQTFHFLKNSPPPPLEKFLDPRLVPEIQRSLRASIFFFEVRKFKKRSQFFFSVYMRSLTFSNCLLAMFLLKIETLNLK